uniref:Uncharacterized protein LOC113791320 n=1 Tax=Dermatophagoides pteronyssinus TaxID=6956 RepID=A0A6P6XY62_DERPT|nr:uncharacterized protein LOC113791320 [Dermatophagoides pteronyssinus]
MDNKMENEKFNNFFDFELLMQKYQSKLWTIPFIGGILLFILLISCYLITSFVRGYPLIWLVSDIGGSSPVAGYFSQGVDIFCLMFIFSAYLRCKQVEYYIKRIIIRSDNQQVNNPKMIKKLQEKNYQSFISAIICSIGFMMIANFNTYEHFIEHSIATGFMFGIIFFLLSQTFIAEKLYECNQIESRPISLKIVTYIITFGWPLITAIFVCSLLLNGSLFDWFKLEQRLYWPSDSPSYHLYRFGVIIEWLVIMSYSPALIILSYRMRSFKHWNLIFY